MPAFAIDVPDWDDQANAKRKSDVKTSFDDVFGASSSSSSLFDAAPSTTPTLKSQKAKNKQNKKKRKIDQDESTTSSTSTVSTSTASTLTASSSSTANPSTSPTVVSKTKNKKKRKVDLPQTTTQSSSSVSSSTATTNKKVKIKAQSRTTSQQEPGKQQQEVNPKSTKRKSSTKQQQPTKPVHHEEESCQTPTSNPKKSKSNTKSAETRVDQTNKRKRIENEEKTDNIASSSPTDTNINTSSTNSAANPSTSPTVVLTKSQKKRLKKKKTTLKYKDVNAANGDSNATDNNDADAGSSGILINNKDNGKKNSDKKKNAESTKSKHPNKKNIANKQQQMPKVVPKAANQPKLTIAQKRLQGARFRMLNEKLYTTTGDEAFELFSSNPTLFEVYHDGFKTQVEKWPVNPVDMAIEWLKSKPSSLTVADFGCGEAAIAQSVKQKVHSFDLVAHNEFVTACDIAHTPLGDNEVDVAVFSLALMGTNHTQYILEAHRVLKKQGHMRIYEVISRIQDMEEFIAVIEAAGFNFKSKGPENKMFVELNFVKNRTTGDAGVEEAQPLLPCIYKRR